ERPRLVRAAYGAPQPTWRWSPPHLWSGPTSPAPSARARRVRGGGDRPDHDEDDVDDHGNEQHERPDDGGITGPTPVCWRRLRPPPARRGGSAGGKALALSRLHPDKSAARRYWVRPVVLA